LRKEEPLPSLPKGEGLTNSLEGLAATVQSSKIQNQNCRLIFFALIVQLRISALFSKKDERL
jgi:hypothetical protein